MRRYLRVLSIFWRSSVAAEAEYRWNFVLAALSSLGNLAGSLFGVFLFYRGDYTFEGWTWDEVLVVLGVFTILTGYSTAFLTPNLNRIVLQVQEGTFDFVLLKPIDSQFSVSLRTLSPWGLPDMVAGLGLVLYGARGLSLSPLQLLSGVAPLLAAMVILYSLWFLIAATTIWFVKVYNATEVLRGLLEAGRFPMDAYPVAYRFFFTFVVPVAFLTTVPAEATLGRSALWWSLGGFGLAGATFLGARAFWRYALRSYTSASS